MTDRAADMESLEKQLDGLVSAYQVMLNSTEAKAMGHVGRFFTFLDQLTQMQKADPRSPEVLLQILHTAVFWLAEAKDNMDKGDGNRRQGRLRS